MNTNEPTPLPPVVKGDADYRTYRPLLLNNGLSLLLARDPQSKHLAASVAVHAGASSDPRSLSGLAHFTEHMCFLGSRAYPEENAYKRYLAQHGGRSNASTGMSHTTYQFDVLADHGEKALDMFSHFFISPLFTKSGTQREVQAVDSENSKNLVSDGRRRLQVLKSLADEDHHYSKFSTGNRITLPACAPEGSGGGGGDGNVDPEPGAPNVAEKHPLEDIVRGIGGGGYNRTDAAEFVRAALLAFHERHYRPKNMTAVVVGPQSLDELESWAVPRFGRIPDRWASEEEEQGEGDDDDDAAAADDAEKWRATKRAAARVVDESSGDAPPISTRAAVDPDPAFRPELQGGTWPVVVTTKPLQSVRNLDLHFPLPPTYRDPDRSPTSLLSHLFGHEGPGSAFARLQDAGHVTSLTAGNRLSGPDQALFRVAVTLTAEGEKRWREVAKVVFDYGRMVCRAAEGASTSGDGDACDGGEHELRRIWDEVSALDRMHFHQTSPGAVYNFAPSVAQSMSKHGSATCLSAGSRLNENGATLPLEETLEFCRRIVPGNCFIERCSEDAWKEMEATWEGKEGDGENSGDKGFVFGRKTEKWYGVDYFVSPVDDKDVLQWESDSDEAILHLPKPNRYIPRSLELCKDLPEEAKVPRIEKPIDPPKLIVNKPNGRLWWRLDDRYALPKAKVTVLIRTATAENKFQRGADPSADLRWDYHAETAMRSNFLTRIFSDALAQDTYDSYLAGLGWSLSKSSSGFTLSCSGYSDRLPDLAIKLLTDFCQVDGETFLKESHFTTTKDKIVRGLKSYFESRRADSLALYYRDFLLSSKGDGVSKNLKLAEGMALSDVAEQHQEIWTDPNILIDIFYTGNVSQKEAEGFFDKTMSIIEKTRSKVLQEHAEQKEYSPWVPGPFERRLPPGEEIELHFASQNPKEENGAVLVTYQSQVEGFKGKSLSSDESLQQSAAIRLLCKMIKEPLFNELRTKQQLGYIVSSYYDVNYSSRQNDWFTSNMPNGQIQPFPVTTSIDSLVVYVLSRKEDPNEVANRIDDFLLNFRSRLGDMTPSEIEDYADSLALALTKPIRKLGDEASVHMAKIRRYGPETTIGGRVGDLPWDNPEVLAGAIRKLDSDILLQVYDSLVMKKESRSRIKSFVYGKTFPLKEEKPSWTGDKFSAFTMEELMKKRKSLIAFDPSNSYQNAGSLWNVVEKHKTRRYAAAAVALVGVGVIGTVALKGRGKQKH